MKGNLISHISDWNVKILRTFVLVMEICMFTMPIASCLCFISKSSCRPEGIAWSNHCTRRYFLAVLQVASQYSIGGLKHGNSKLWNIGHCEGEVKGYLNLANLHKRCGNPILVQSHYFTIIIIYLQYFYPLIKTTQKFSCHLDYYGAVLRVCWLKHDVIIYTTGITHIACGNPELNSNIQLNNTLCYRCRSK